MMNRKMIKQAQQLQRRMTELQEELESATVEATAQVTCSLVKAKP